MSSPTNEHVLLKIERVLGYETARVYAEPLLKALSPFLNIPEEKPPVRHPDAVWWDGGNLTEIQEFLGSDVQLRLNGDDLSFCGGGCDGYLRPGDVVVRTKTADLTLGLNRPGIVCFTPMAYEVWRSIQERYPG